MKVIFCIAALYHSKELVETLDSLNKCSQPWKAVVKLKVKPELELKVDNVEFIYGVDNGIYNAFNSIVDHIIDLDVYTFFLGEGDCLENDLSFLSNADLKDIPLIYGRAMIYTPTGVFSRLSKNGILCNGFYSGRPYVPCHQSILVHSSVYRDVGLFNESFHVSADADFMIRCFLNKINSKIVIENIASMASHGASSNPINFKSQTLDNLKLYLKYNKSFNNRYAFKFIIFTLRRFLSMAYYRVMP
ncbi:predicted glycosyltransferase [Psychromonas ingrahamii 37]|uniref:Predicted glycosyltransferase n=1 Tax=Psychromonas ingrahamii (strain DSM 17664 / CCUG 51855 / 37) TaxID=357804 RepID=A1ST15_PSYIN|nr:glycosyl transferase [Psychromonas ingrahamii]ABM02630.1 predicted glycosyltransferase [Psychromonas ingrahamii 37]